VNGFSLNGAGLNSSANTNSFVAFPASTGTFSVGLSERLLSFFAATTATLSIDSSGSIISISPFAPTTATFSIDSVGSLLNFTPFPANTMTMGVAMSGNPILTGGLSADAGLDVALDGPLLRISYFAPEQMALSIESAGDLLRAIRYMSAAATLAIDMDGPLLSFSPMTGAMSFSINMAGAIAVNATEQDAEERTMVRPYQERTMVRQ